MNNYYELNLQFYDALNQIFKINKHKTWSDLSKEITLEKIAETYKVFAKLFPYNIDRYSMLPKNNSTQKLTAIFQGDLDGATIINNVARYSLYCDEIIVFHPLQNPEITHPDYNPITKTSMWKREFVNALYFYIVLQKWVRAGIVHIIENPFHFDQDAKTNFTELAVKRAEHSMEEIMTPEVREEQREKIDKKLRETLLGMPIVVLEKHYKKIFPDYSELAIKELVIELKKYEKKQPLYVDFGDANNTDYTQMDELSINRQGGNIEMIDALCRLTGSHSYTSEKIVKRQLELKGTNPFWTKFGTLYSGLDLKYLDNVDTDFALRIRKEERISGLRSALRQLNSFLEQTELDKLSDDKILNFSDRMNQEVKKSEEDWAKIINEANKANVVAITGTATITAIIDPTKFIVPAIAIPTSIAITNFFKQRNLKSYRAKDPYSIFVDLKSKKPSFFSEFKNCVF